VDLLLSFPKSTGPPSELLPEPTVTLLEYNASPDFHQSGDRLRKELGDMFRGVIRIAIVPFFGLELNEDEENGGDARDGEWDIGDERWGWTLCGRGEVRGSSWA
jgi:tubulin--tyrosine ligase